MDLGEALEEDLREALEEILGEALEEKEQDMEIS